MNVDNLKILVNLDNSEFTLGFIYRAQPGRSVTQSDHREESNLSTTLKVKLPTLVCSFKGEIKC